jgi:DNA-binding transcriptional ArsR family regulator
MPPDRHATRYACSGYLDARLLAVSNAAQSWAWKQAPKQASDKVVLVALADNAWEDGSNAWPSVKLLSEKTGLSERTVQRSLRRLVDAGYIAVQEEAQPSRFRPTVYRVDLSRPSEVDAPGVKVSPPDTATPGETLSPPDIDGCHQVSLSASPGVTVSPEPSTNPQEEPSNTFDAKRGSRVPDRIPVTAEMVDWAKANKITVDLLVETEQFIDYHRGKGTIRKDWVASWRTWMRNTLKWAGQNHSSPGPHQPYRNPSDQSVYDLPLEAS